MLVSLRSSTDSLGFGWGSGELKKSGSRELGRLEPVLYPAAASRRRRQGQSHELRVTDWNSRLINLNVLPRPEEYFIWD